MNEKRCCGCQQNYVTNGCANTCNCNPMPAMPAPGCFESCCKVVEAPICHQPEFHHFHKVDHIVPVYINNLHHHHTHHEYMTQQQQTVENLGYDYYHQNPAVLQAAMPMPNEQLVVPTNFVGAQQMTTMAPMPGMFNAQQMPLNNMPNMNGSQQMSMNGMQNMLGSQQMSMNGMQNMFGSQQMMSQNVFGAQPIF